MSMSKDDQGAALAEFMTGLERRNPGEHEFHQAVHEVAAHVIPFVMANPAYHEARILERLTEPDRVIIFRVAWQDDEGNVRVSSESDTYVNYLKGANIAGFVKVADAMLAYGVM